MLPISDEAICSAVQPLCPQLDTRFIDEDLCVIGSSIAIFITASVDACDMGQFSRGIGGSILSSSSTL